MPTYEAAFELSDENLILRLHDRSDDGGREALDGDFKGLLKSGLVDSVKSLRVLFCMNFSCGGEALHPRFKQ